MCLCVYIGFPGGAVVKNLPADAGDVGLISELGRPPPPPEEEMATYSSILAWEIPRTDKPGGLQPMGAHSWARLNNCTHPRTCVYIHKEPYIKHLILLNIIYCINLI